MTIAQSHLTVDSRQTLLPTDRRHLRQTLSALPPVQFDELVLLLDFSPERLSVRSTSFEESPQETLRQRSQALLRWATSPVGPGIARVEKVLAKVISKYSTTAKVVMSFAVDRSVYSITVETIESFVQYLKERVEDESLEVDFFEQGGMKLILKGGDRGLELLKDLFELGKLNYPGLPSIETIYSLDESLLDERKARLVKTLQLRDQFLSPSRARARARARACGTATAQTKLKVSSRFS